MFLIRFNCVYCCVEGSSLSCIFMFEVKVVFFKLEDVLCVCYLRIYIERSGIGVVVDW